MNNIMEAITIQKNEYQTLLRYKQEFLKIRNEIFDFADENEINDDFSNEILAMDKDNFLSKKESKNILNTLQNKAKENV